MNARRSPSLSAGMESCGGEGGRLLPEVEGETMVRGASREPPPPVEPDTRGFDGEAGAAWPKEGRDTRT